MTADSTQRSLRQFTDHPRNWRENRYVYPVISRRSHGLSIGINLNPDAACNFDCIYCQVDRTTAPRVRDVDPDRLRAELSAMIDLAQSGALFDDPTFADVPPALRTIRDLAFSGDGEPTTCKVFRECVELTAELKRRAHLENTRIVLITDACYLTKPEVAAALLILDESGGEIWAKLDAGTEAYYRLINRPNFSLSHVIENITAAARVRPVVIQSLFMRVHGKAPSAAEIEAYIGRLKQITESNGRIRSVQVYTVARRPAEEFVSALSAAEVDKIAAEVHDATGLTARAFYGAE